MSSLTRMLAILDLFDLDQPFWTSEQVMERMNFTRPTTFRYLKVLRDAGLIARFSGGYVLGAKAVKLDYIIRQSDPLLRLFEPIMKSFRDDTDCDIILASLLGHDLFATIHAPSSSQNISWPRGRSMPLTRGAGGIVVLASLTRAQFRRVLSDPTLAASIDDTTALEAEIAQVKSQGYSVSLGALEPENVGIAVPVTLSGVPPTALVVVMSRQRFKLADPQIVVQMLENARAEMTRAYDSLSQDVEASAKT